MQQFQDLPDSATLERIVREVLAALGAEASLSGPAEPAGSATPAATPTATSAEATLATTAPAAEGNATRIVPAAQAPQARMVSTRDGELSIPERVVTVAALDGRLEGIRRLLVPPGAILTPAVRDLLRQRRILVTYGPVWTSSGPGDVPEPAAGDDAAERAMPVVLVTRRISAAQINGLFRGEGFKIAPEEMDCMVRASQRTAEAVRQPGGRAVVVTSHVAAGVCLANRLSGVRAVAGRRPSEVAADAAAVGANVLVADARQGVFQIKRMILEFVRSPRRCPEAFAPHLS
ncbi:MAG: hypothetical protein ACUVTW_02070 [Thermogutta sp.]